MAEWFYQKNGVKAGPIDTATLKLLASSGQINPTDTIRRDAMDKWVPASQAKGLFANAAPASAATPKVPPPFPPVQQDQPHVVAAAPHGISAKKKLVIGVGILVVILALVSVAEKFKQGGENAVGSPSGNAAVVAALPPQAPGPPPQAVSAPPQTSDPDPIASFGSLNADTASDDDIERAVARGRTENETDAINRAHRLKEFHFLDFMVEIKQCRELIKYSCNSDGTTTLDQYVQKEQADRAKLAAQDQIDQQERAAQRAKDEAEAAAEKAKQERFAAVEASFDAQEAQLDADYGPRIKAIQNDAANPNALDQASALTRELANKRQDLFKARRAAERAARATTQSS
jgi:hypothetical protein